MGIVGAVVDDVTWEGLCICAGLGLGWAIVDNITCIGGVADRVGVGMRWAVVDDVACLLVDDGGVD